MKKRIVKRIIWIVLILVVLSAVGYGVKMSGSKAVDVDTSTVKRGDIDKYVEETAVVRMENQTSIYSVQGGRVTEVLVDVGDNIKTGDVLARLDNKDVQLQIRALEAQKLTAAATYEEALKPVEQEEINKLTALVKSAEASYNEAKRVADNNKVLYESGAISLNTYQNSLSQLATAESSMETAKNNLALAQKDTTSSYAKKKYDAQIAGIQAQIEQQKKQLNDLTIKATMDGMVMAKEIEAGSFVQPGMLIFEIGSGSKEVFLESDILVDDIGNVKQGSAVIIENDDLGIKGVKGTVRMIYPKAFNKTSDLGIEQKRVKTEIDFDSSGLELKPGYDLDIKIITASSKGTLLIHESAVFDYQGKAHVFVNEGGVAKLREIEKGLESDELVEVAKGLKEGEEVVLSPDEKLAEGTKIQ